MSTPATTISLCRGVRLTNRYDHSLYFPNKAAQEDYFAGKVARTLTNYSYVRKTWNLKVAATMEEARQWTYLFFNNTASGKRYYYFINNVEYINDATVELSLEIDVLQTYMFDWTLNRCYVEREHSVTDELGENTVDEGLDVGEYIVVKQEDIDLSTDPRVMIASSIDINRMWIDNEEDKILGSKYDNIFGGFQISAAPIADWASLASQLWTLSERGKIDSIFTMWMFPGELIETENKSYNDLVAPYVKASKTFTVKTERPTTVGNTYTPKNKKLLQYPYAFLYATNNDGGSAIYRYEYFDKSIVHNEASFLVRGNLTPDAVVKITPRYYKGQYLNQDESLAMTGFPLCSWNSDPYKLWLAQNQNQQKTSVAISGLQIAAGAAMVFGSHGLGSAAGAGLIASGATSIANQLAQRKDADVQPPQSRGSIGGSFNLAKGVMNFYLMHKSVDYYHARMIDDYFTMYGYATRTVKVPNISSRPCWNYVKTVGSNISGDIAGEDLTKINDVFDKGVTFWKASATIGDYSLDNTPIE